jgi:hypothetical protein
MYFQCPEASFDLLNDRISFFGKDLDDLDLETEEGLVDALAAKMGKGDLVHSRKTISADSENETEIEVDLMERLRDVKLGAASDSEDVSRPEMVHTPDNKREGKRRSSIHAIARTCKS